MKRKSNRKMRHNLTIKEWNQLRNNLETFMKKYGFSLADLKHGFNLTDNETNLLGKFISGRSKDIRKVGPSLAALIIRVCKGCNGLSKAILENFVI